MGWATSTRLVTGTRDRRQHCTDYHGGSRSDPNDYQGPSRFGASDYHSGSRFTLSLYLFSPLPQPDRRTQHGRDLLVPRGSLVTDQDKSDNRDDCRRAAALVVYHAGSG